MPFGKHKNRTLDEIASSDEGLHYLIWISEEFATGSVLSAVKAYCSDPTIAREIENL
jgi:hypothetical protein